MTLDELIARVEDKLPPAPEDQLAQFEAGIGHCLPEDYRYFLVRCNGGHLGGRYGINTIGGFRKETDYSLVDNWNVYCDRIPDPLIWIMDDPFGNAICLCLAGKNAGAVYHWDHENEPVEDHWDGAMETAGNIVLLAKSFTDFVNGLEELPD
jgi:hypothetical protein